MLRNSSNLFVVITLFLGAGLAGCSPMKSSSAQKGSPGFDASLLSSAQIELDRYEYELNAIVDPTLHIKPKPSGFSENKLQSEGIELEYSWLKIDPIDHGISQIKSHTDTLVVWADSLEHLGQYDCVAQFRFKGEVIRELHLPQPLEIRRAADPLRHIFPNIKVETLEDHRSISVVVNGLTPLGGYFHDPGSLSFNIALGERNPDAVTSVSETDLSFNTTWSFQCQSDSLMSRSSLASTFGPPSSSLDLYEHGLFCGLGTYSSSTQVLYKGIPLGEPLVHAYSVELYDLMKDTYLPILKDRMYAVVKERTSAEPGSTYLEIAFGLTDYVPEESYYNDYFSLLYTYKIVWRDDAGEIVDEDNGTSVTYHYSVEPFDERVQVYHRLTGDFLFELDIPE